MSVPDASEDPVAAFYGITSSPQAGKVRSSLAAASLTQVPKKDKKTATTSSPRRPVSAHQWGVATIGSPRRPKPAVAAAAAGKTSNANQLLTDTFNVHVGSLPKRTKNGEARPLPHDTCPWRPDASENAVLDLHSCDLKAAARKRFDVPGQRPVSARVARPASAGAVTARPPSAAVAVAAVGRQQFLLQCVEHGHSPEQIERLMQQFDIGSAPVESVSVSHRQEPAQYAQAMPSKNHQSILREQRSLHAQTPVVKPYRQNFTDPEQMHNAFVDAHKSFEVIKGICEMGNGQFLTHQVQMHERKTQPHSLMAKRAQTLKTPSVKLRGYDSKVSCNAYVAGRQNASDIRTRDRRGNHIF